MGEADYEIEQPEEKQGIQKATVKITGHKVVKEEDK